MLDSLSLENMMSAADNRPFLLSLLLMMFIADKSVASFIGVSSLTIFLTLCLVLLWLYQHRHLSFCLVDCLIPVRCLVLLGESFVDWLVI